MARWHCRLCAVAWLCDGLCAPPATPTCAYPIDSFFWHVEVFIYDIDAGTLDLWNTSVFFALQNSTRRRVRLAGKVGEACLG